MSNLANIQKVHYCDKKSGNNASCSKYATHISELCHKSEDTTLSVFKYPVTSCYRCDEHKNTATVGKKVFKTKELDQSFGVHKINEYLKSLIGKTITSRVHTAKELVVQYVKPNGGVMCLQPITKKWKFVYYHQIESVA